MKGKGDISRRVWERRRILIFPALVKILLLLLRERTASLMEVDLVNCKRGSFNLLLRVRCKPSLFRLNSRCREA